MRRSLVLGVCASLALAPVLVSMSTAASGAAVPTQSRSAAKVPRPAHVVLVVFENKEQQSVIGNPDAPYFNKLAATGASMTQSFGITHPSQPNYVALFSGSTQGLTDDTCPHTFSANNEANQLITAGDTFGSYAEDLPSVGSKVCLSGEYARKHAPWTNFSNVPDNTQQPYTAFPTDYSTLPDVSWVIPNLCDDMHDCSIATGDTWLKANLGAYAKWAKKNNSLLIVTFDEDDSLGDNQIATIFYGAKVVTGSYDEHITHYTVLRTIEAMYGLKALGGAKQVQPITDIWK